MVASKLPQILQLNPTNELVFQGPFDKVVTSYLELKNPYHHRVCFKVKTTAPRRYCVRPNSGIIEPDGGKVKIAIMLQPMEPESFSERNKHKFMVQSTILPSEEESSFEDIWANASHEHIMDSKLKCTFTESAEADSNYQKSDTSTPDLISPVKITSTPVADKQNTTQSGEQATSSQNQPQQQQQQRQAQQNQSSTSFTVKPLERSRRQQEHLQQQSTSSFHDSFHQAMSDDKTIVVIVALLMLIIGVVLGKYII